ncbi:MAG: L-threonylcarbamoyladenylate synthase, partial [Myxococcota bacterium]
LAVRGWVDLGPLDHTARERGERVLEAFWPGPLTMVLPVGSAIPGLVTSGLDTVAVRSPRHPVFQAVLEHLDAPLAAPSANRFGRISPTRAADVFEELAGRIPLIIDGGPTEVGVESTIVRLERDGAITLLRSGGCPMEAIEQVAGCRLKGAGQDDQSAPGRLASHYAPGHRMRPLPGPAGKLSAADVRALVDGCAPEQPVGLLLFAPLNEDEQSRLRSLFDRPVDVRVLGEDSEPAARALFRSMRELDRVPDVVLFAEPVTRAHGLWPAIAERLNKAMA